MGHGGRVFGTAEDKNGRTNLISGRWTRAAVSPTPSGYIKTVSFRDPRQGSATNALCPQGCSGLERQIMLLRPVLVPRNRKQ